MGPVAPCGVQNEQTITNPFCQYPQSNQPCPLNNAPPSGTSRSDQRPPTMANATCSTTTRPCPSRRRANIASNAAAPWSTRPRPRSRASSRGSCTGATGMTSSRASTGWAPSGIRARSTRRSCPPTRTHQTPIGSGSMARMSR